MGGGGEHDIGAGAAAAEAAVLSIFYVLIVVILVRNYRPVKKYAKKLPLGHLIKDNFGICVKLNKLLSGNDDSFNADSIIYSYFHLKL